jgi:hypothetical protein
VVERYRNNQRRRLKKTKRSSSLMLYPCSFLFLSLFSCVCVRLAARKFVSRSRGSCHRHPCVTNPITTKKKGPVVRETKFGEMKKMAICRCRRDSLEIQSNIKTQHLIEPSFSVVLIIVSCCLLGKIPNQRERIVVFIYL